MRQSYLAATMSESSVMKHLTVDILMHGISEVAFAKGGNFLTCIIRMKPTYAGSVMQAMLEASGVAPPMCKYVIAVDDDVDIQEWEDINWALCYHCQPAQRCPNCSPHSDQSADLSTSSGPEWRQTASQRCLLMRRVNGSIQQ